MQPKRKSQRKHGYDYSQPGHYDVTVCTQNRSCLFGVIDNGDKLLNEAGRMIDETWCETPDHCPGITLDVMQIMPNHRHGMVVVREVGAAPRGRPPYRMDNVCETSNNLERSSHGAIEPGFQSPRVGRAQGPAPTGCLSLSNVIERFKSLTTTWYIDGVKHDGWQAFPGTLWQRNDHDRIVRNETELNRIRPYICTNPVHWESDENNIDVNDEDTTKG